MQPLPVLWLCSAATLGDIRVTDHSHRQALELSWGFLLRAEPLTANSRPRQRRLLLPLVACAWELQLAPPAMQATRRKCRTHRTIAIWLSRRSVRRSAYAGTGSNPQSAGRCDTSATIFPSLPHPAYAR